MRLISFFIFFGVSSASATHDRRIRSQRGAAQQRGWSQASSSGTASSGRFSAQPNSSAARRPPPPPPTPTPVFRDPGAITAGIASALERMNDMPALTEVLRELYQELQQQRDRPQLAVVTEEWNSRRRVPFNGLQYALKLGKRHAVQEKCFFQ